MTPAMLDAARPNTAELPAAALATHVRDCVATGVERRLLLLHLSRLPPNQTLPTHLRLARHAIEPLGRLSRARFFRLDTPPVADTAAPDLAASDLAVVWRGPGGPALDEALRGLASLLVDTNGPVRSLEDLVELAELPRDGPALLRRLAGPAAHALARPAPNGRRKLDAAALAAIDTALIHADVARFVRRKPVCALTGRHPTLRWEKRYLLVAELLDTLSPEHDAKAEPWLFHRLAQSLDRRMLALMTALEELRDAGPFALNITADSILSPEFLRFDDALPGRLRGEVVLELQAADILADSPRFLFARNFARGRHYRLLLRGLTPALLPLFSLDRLEMDLLRLDWGADTRAHVTAPLLAAAGGPGRVLLARADTADALDWGWSMGIALFEGRALDPRAAAHP